MSWQVGDYASEGEKPFAHGNFGTLYKGRRVSDGTRVALKLVVLTGSADSAEKLAAERHGAMLQQRFEHAHGMVPEVYDYGADGNDFYIAMEFVEGGSLAGVIRKGPLAPHAAARHAVWVCDFLDKAHRFETTIEHVPYERIVHADLKPEHVLIDASGEMKVLDFGIAKALAKTTQVTTNNWGTTPYASPERLEKGHVNEHVDFWSLGVMLYEMVAGHRPYPALEHNRSQLEHAIRTNAPREPLPAACPPELAAIINKMLAYQLERRYSTAAAIRSDLDLFLSGAQPAATNEFVTPPTVPIRPVTSSRTPVAPTLPVVPPTEPLPAAGAGGVAVAAPPAAVPVVRTRFGRLRRTVRRLAWVGALLWVVGIVAGEGAAWVAAERFRAGIDAIEGRTLQENREEYDALRRRSMFKSGLRSLVNVPLVQRLDGIAGTVIMDYRREEPATGQADWRQANDALQWALELAPGDRRLRARQLLCEGHLDRFAARQARGAQASRQLYLRALQKFRAAAELDNESFDPYLAISEIAVYRIGDVDQAAAAMEEAEHRGYTPGRRERAQLGDGYMRRATASRTLAHTLSGDQRRRELEKARDDYGRCISAFDPIVAFSRSAQNLESCKRQLERVTQELAQDEDAEKLEYEDD